MKGRSPKPKKSQGAKRMKELGKSFIMLAVTPEQHALIRQAARIEMRPMTQFTLFYAIQAAERAIREAGND